MGPQLGRSRCRPGKGCPSPPSIPKVALSPAPLPNRLGDVLLAYGSGAVEICGGHRHARRLSPRYPHGQGFIALNDANLNGDAGIRSGRGRPCLSRDLDREPFSPGCIGEPPVEGHKRQVLRSIIRCYKGRSKLKGVGSPEWVHVQEAEGTRADGFEREDVRKSLKQPLRPPARGFIRLDGQSPVPASSGQGRSDLDGRKVPDKPGRIGSQELAGPS